MNHPTAVYLSKVLSRIVEHPVMRGPTVRVNQEEPAKALLTEFRRQYVPGNGSFRSDCTYNDVMLTGLQAHKYLPFVTFKERVQVGMNFSGGFGVYSGTATQTHYDSDFVFVPPNSNRIVEKPPVTTPGIEARTLFVMDRVPIGKLELAVAGILAPGLKVRVGYGFDFPGYPIFSVSGVYLFGSE